MNGGEAPAAAPGRAISTSIRREEAYGPEIDALLGERDAYFQALYADHGPRAARTDLTAANICFLTARTPNGLVGCGALIVQADHGELKHVFVRPEARGGGVGARLVAGLEVEARAAGVTLLRLEVGVRQTSAIRLYQSLGYCETGPFGPYRAGPLNSFRLKRLAG